MPPYLERREFQVTGQTQGSPIIPKMPGSARRHRMSPERIRRIHRRRIRHRIYWAAGFMALLLAVFVGLFAMSAVKVKREVQSAAVVAGGLQSSLVSGGTKNATSRMSAFSRHIDAAYAETNGLLWELASAVPYYGSDVAVVRTAVTALENISSQAMPELNKALSGFSPKRISIANATISIPGLAEAAPHLLAASQVATQASNGLKNAPQPHIAQISHAMGAAKAELNSFATLVNNASLIAQLAPKMLNTDGAQAPRNYLVLSENNAELRPSGGLPGSWGLLTVSKGKLSLRPFVSDTSLPWLGQPVIPIAADELQLFSEKLGTIAQDVNFTPDFPRTGELARAMWNRQFHSQVDGVIAVDPVFLQNLLSVSGPATLPDGSVLDGTNTVRTLLHQVYFDKPVSAQDAWFSMAASAAFQRIFTGGSNPLQFVSALGKSVAGGHLQVWSARADEERLLASTAIAGALQTAGSKPQIGVYFSDQTQSKMDWYLKREVSAQPDGTAADGSRRYTVRVRITNTMKPGDVAGTPLYILGGLSGMKPGQINTAVYLYAPAHGRLVDWKLSDGSKLDALSTHDGLTVGLKKVILNPGQSFELGAHMESAPGVETDAALRQTPQIPGQTD